jgi:RNA recognition motif-containing protein
MVSLKIKGLPYSTTFEEVADFFKDFQYIEKSVVLGLGRDGRKNGFGAILFEDEKEAKEAMNGMNGQYVGSRYVDLSQITYGDYSRFNGPPAGNYGGQPGSYVKLSKHVGPDNQEKCLLMRGCPYKVEAKDIIDFFDGYGTISPDDVFIEESNGRRTGSALVIFENKEIAQDAKAALNKKNIGEEQRYVELHDCNDLFMKKVCQLFDDQEPQNKGTPYEEEKE